jgi:hypothetical protein
MPVISSEKFMQPIVNAVTGASPLVVTLKQPNVVAPENEFRISIERVASATGLVTVKIKYFGNTQRNFVERDINLAGLSEPKNMFWEGDIEDVEFSHSSLSGTYNAIISGR